jgi:hypothetical protein
MQGRPGALVDYNRTRLGADQARAEAGGEPRQFPEFERQPGDPAMVYRGGMFEPMSVERMYGVLNRNPPKVEPAAPRPMQAPNNEADGLRGILPDPAIREAQIAEAEKIAQRINDAEKTLENGLLSEPAQDIVKGSLASYRARLDALRAKIDENVSTDPSFSMNVAGNAGPAPDPGTYAAGMRPKLPGMTLPIQRRPDGSLGYPMRGPKGHRPRGSSDPIEPDTGYGADEPAFTPFDQIRQAATFPDQPVPDDVRQFIERAVMPPPKPRAVSQPAPPTAPKAPAQPTRIDMLAERNPSIVNATKPESKSVRTNERRAVVLTIPELQEIKRVSQAMQQWHGVELDPTELRNTFAVAIREADKLRQNPSEEALAAAAQAFRVSKGEFQRFADYLYALEAKTKHPLFAMSKHYWQGPSESKAPSLAPPDAPPAPEFDRPAFAVRKLAQEGYLDTEIADELTAMFGRDFTPEEVRAIRGRQGVDRRFAGDSSSDW